MNHVPGNDAIVGGPRGCIITEDKDTFLAEQENPLYGLGKSHHGNVAKGNFGRIKGDNVTIRRDLMGRRNSERGGGDDTKSTFE